MISYKDYFDNRNINPEFYKDFNLPAYLKKVLPKEKDKSILDIGCGFGMMISELTRNGFKNIKGIDLSDHAVSFCIEKGFDVEKTDIEEYCDSSKVKFDFIIMSHVLEHIDKTLTIKILTKIRENLLNDNGFFLVMVPNAQSNTGSYWAYEDFTHYTLFTAGSLYYVLKSAGFNSVKFLDTKGVEDSTLIIKIIKLLFLKIYDLKKKFWNKITSSSYHNPSPRIYTFELRALASKNQFQK